MSNKLVFFHRADAKRALAVEALRALPCQTCTARCRQCLGGAAQIAAREAAMREAICAERAALTAARKLLGLPRGVPCPDALAQARAWAQARVL